MSTKTTAKDTAEAAVALHVEVAKRRGTLAHLVKAIEAAGLDGDPKKLAKQALAVARAKGLQPLARIRGITSGRLLGLYEDALNSGVSRDDLIASLVREGGYSNRTAARQRLGRFEKEMRQRGLSLLPLRGSSMRRSSKALVAAYSCLVSD